MQIERPTWTPVFEALNRAGVRYVIVGGLAVVLQGYVRLTADVDLMIDLAEAPAHDAIAALDPAAGRAAASSSNRPSRSRTSGIDLTHRTSTAFPFGSLPFPTSST